GDGHDTVDAILKSSSISVVSDGNVMIAGQDGSTLLMSNVETLTVGQARSEEGVRTVDIHELSATKVEQVVVSLGDFDVENTVDITGGAVANQIKVVA